MSGLLISLDLSIPKMPKSSPKMGIAELGIGGEVMLAEIIGGGKANQYFSTSRGGRYVDVLSDGIAYESKVGYVSYSPKGLAWKQMLKDAELIKDSEIDGATWYFFRSARTGKIGADQRFLDALTQHGINYVIYDK